MALEPDVPTTVKEVRERLEALLEDIEILITRSDARALARPLKMMRAELSALVEFYGATKAPTRNPRDPSWRAKNRDDGTRYCPKCGTWKPEDEFDYKDRSKGLLRSHCRECWRAYQRERYVAANKRAIIIEVMDGDGTLEATCNCCGKRFEIGDRIVGSNLVHENCP